VLLGLLKQARGFIGLCLGIRLFRLPMPSLHMRGLTLGEEVEEIRISCRLPPHLLGGVDVGGDGLSTNRLAACEGAQDVHALKIVPSGI